MPFVTLKLATELKKGDVVRFSYTDKRTVACFYSLGKGREYIKFLDGSRIPLVPGARYTVVASA